MRLEDKLFIVFTSTCILYLLIFVYLVVHNEPDQVEELYPLAATVISIENDIVSVKDFNKNVWRFKGADDWEIDDECVMIMSDNCTPMDIKDDKILKVHYSRK